MVQTFEEKFRKNLMVSEYYNNDNVKPNLSDLGFDFILLSGNASYPGCWNSSLWRTASSQNGNQSKGL